MWCKKRFVLVVFAVCLLCSDVFGEVYFDRMWAKRLPSRMRTIAAVKATSTNPGAGTTGSFFVRQDQLYIYATRLNDDGAYVGRLYSFSSTGVFVDSVDVWPDADIRYSWCDYSASQDKLYWFYYSGSGAYQAKSKSFGASGAPVTVDAQETQYGLHGNTSQVAIYGSLVWSVLAWNSSNNNQSPVIYRTALGDAQFGDQTRSYSKSVPSSWPTSGSGVHTVVIPVDHNNALILRQGANLWSYHYNTYNNVTSKDLQQVSISADGLNTAGGTVFQHNGKWYYVAGCTARAGKQTSHVGACAVFDLGSRNSYQNFTSATLVAKYDLPIANTTKDYSASNASGDVTFRTVDKGDYVLIYAFAPKNGYACYYFSTKRNYDYTVRLVSNHKYATTTAGKTTYDQTMRSGVAANLVSCPFVCEHTVTYNHQDYAGTQKTDAVGCSFLGWEDRSTIVYWKDNNKTIVQNWLDTLFDAPYYASIRPDVFAAPQYGNNTYDKTGLLRHYLEFGKNEGCVPYQKNGPGNYTRGLYPDKAKVSNLATREGAVAKLYARWDKGKVALPAPTRLAYTFKGWYNKATGGTLIGNAGSEVSISSDKTYYAQWELMRTDEGESDFKDRVTTWTPSSVTFDMNGFSYGSGVYVANGGTREWYMNDIPVSETANTTPYPTEHADKTFTLQKPEGLAFAASAEVRITLFHTPVGGVRTLVAAHTFRVPVIDGVCDVANADNDLYVRTALSLGGSMTAQNVYIEPGACLTILQGCTLTITEKLYIRSRGTEVGSLLNNGVLSLGAGDMIYTRQMSQRNVGEPLALPFDCHLQTNGAGAYVELKTHLQAQTGKNTGNHVAIYKYNGQIRAEQGGKAIVWEPVIGTDITIGAIDGYEIMSGSNFYREYLFPMTYIQSTEVTRDLEAYKCAQTAFSDIGWNFFCTPYTTTYTGNLTLSSGVTQTYPFVTMYNADGSFEQTVGMEATIPPFTPFYVQVNEDATLTYYNGIPSSLRAIQWEQDESATSWGGVVLSNGTLSDKTTMVVNSAYSEVYEVGADLEKMLGPADIARPQVYLLATDGKRAFDAIDVHKATKGVAVGYVSHAGDLTFSLNESFPLNAISHLYLLDKETGITTDLTVQDYTFSTVAGTNESRFVLSVAFRRGVMTRDNAVLGEAMNTHKIVREGNLYITAGGQTYNALGQRR